MSKNFCRTILEIFCFLFILLFVYTGVSKLIDHKTFTTQLISLTGDETMGKTLSYLLPLGELMIAGLIAVIRTRLFGLILFTLLMAGFTGYISYLLVSGKKLPCTCGGMISTMTWKQHLWFNGCFVVAGIASIIVLTGNFYNQSSILHKKSF